MQTHLHRISRQLHAPLRRLMSQGEGKGEGGGVVDERCCCSRCVLRVRSNLHRVLQLNSSDFPDVCRRVRCRMHARKYGCAAGGKGGDSTALVELSYGSFVLLVLGVGAGEEDIENLGFGEFEAGIR